MKMKPYTLIAMLFICSARMQLQAQTTASPCASTNQSAPSGECYVQLEKRVEDLTSLLRETRQQLDASQQHIDHLQEELNSLRSEMAPGVPSIPAANGAALSTSGREAADMNEAVVQLREQQEVQQAEIKQHEQTKVESASKYPVKIYGLVLFDAFANAGVVDDIDLPSLALPRNPGANHGSLGASLRQSLFGVEASGPNVWGARTSANVSADFAGGFDYGYYTSSAANFRIRSADVAMQWNSSAIHFGLSEPLISPLSPSSYVTVAMPSLAWAGNLWNWSPELRVEHFLDLAANKKLGFEGGIWDTPVTGVNATTASRLASSGELSRRPDVMGRLSYRSGQDEHAFSIGVSGSSGHEFFGSNTYEQQEVYPSGQSVHTWAVTTDWRLPIGPRFEVTGEFYRGVGLGGFGGGAYKDVLIGIDPATKAIRVLGLNASGGWTQLKTRFTQLIEANASFGFDGGYASDFHQLQLSQSTNVLELYARNRMFVGNLIFRPKTYLILSPEYRRIDSWQITGPANYANLFSFVVGYQF